MGEQSLKQKTVGALLWSLLDRLGQQALLFIVGIIAANILEVEDYALVGMLAFFSAVANVLLDSGFSTALIQKKEVSETEYSSVFWFNIGMSLLLYLVLVLCSPFIARFFGYPQLAELAVLVFLTLPLNALGIIQSTLLNKEVRFKILARTNVMAVAVSSGTSLVMALCGMGVWALAWQPVILVVVRTVLLWWQGSWRPRWVFSMAAIRGLFTYAANLMLANLLNTCFLHVYTLVIGKLYPAKQLGYYTQGNKNSDMGVTLLYGSIQNATFPIFSSIQDDKERLLRAFRKTIRFTACITFPAMAGMIIIARPLIELLLKEEWWPSIPFFQLLCAGGCFTILTAVNNNFIKVSGRTRGVLALEFIKVGLTVISLLLTYDKPVLVMVAALVVVRLIVYLLNAVFTARLTGYGFGMQLLDSAPYLLLSLLMAAVIYPLGYLIANNALLLIAQLLIGFAVYVSAAYLSGSKILKESIELLINKK